MRIGEMPKMPAIMAEDMIVEGGPRLTPTESRVRSFKPEVVRTIGYLCDQGVPGAPRGKVGFLENGQIATVHYDLTPDL